MLCYTFLGYLKSSQRFKLSVQHELNIDFGKLTSLIDYRIVVITTVRLEYDQRYSLLGVVRKIILVLRGTG